MAMIRGNNVSSSRDACNVCVPPEIDCRTGGTSRFGLLHINGDASSHTDTSMERVHNKIRYPAPSHPFSLRDEIAVLPPQTRCVQLIYRRGMQIRVYKSQTPPESNTR